MRTKARVIESDGEYVTVLCERTSACDGCHKQSAGECSVCSLMSSGKTMKTRAYNAIGAAVGDTVELESPSARILGYAALVFLVPIVALIAGYLVSGIWIQAQPWRYAIALAMLVLTFVSIRIYSVHHEKRGPDIVAVAVVREDEHRCDEE